MHTLPTLHYNTLHYVTLHYIILHYNTLHSIHTYRHTYLHTKACGNATRQYSDIYLARCNWHNEANSERSKLFAASYLEKHADDSHHRQSSVCNFGIELLGFLSRVSRGQHLESKVSSICISSWGLFLGDFAESHVGQDLTPSSRVGIWASKLCQPTKTSKTHLIVYV